MSPAAGKLKTAHKPKMRTTKRRLPSDRVVVMPYHSLMGEFAGLTNHNFSEKKLFAHFSRFLLSNHHSKNIPAMGMAIHGSMGVST